MRRVIGFVLLGLGVFALALGLLLRFYAYPRLAKAPLDVDTVSVATGSGITALVFVEKDGATLPEIRDDLDLTATRWVKGDLTQPEVVENGDLAVWIEAVEIVDQDGNRVKATERELCVDRHTNEAHTPCTTQYIISRVDPRTFVPVRDTGVAQPGLNLKFPFDTEARDYEMFDLSIRDKFTVRFDGEDEIDGLGVYRFVQDIPATKIESRTVPGTMVGNTEPTVDVDLYYQNRRTMWVEPVTGQIIRGEEQQRQELREPGASAGSGTVVFDGTLRFNDETVNKNVEEAKANKSKLWLLITLPIILWIAGGMMLLAALVLLLPRRGGSDGETQPDDPTLTTQLSGTTR